MKVGAAFLYRICFCSYMKWHCWPTVSFFSGGDQFLGPLHSSSVPVSSSAELLHDCSLLGVQFVALP